MFSIVEKSPAMTTFTNPSIDKSLLIDISETHQLVYWADKLGVRPEVIKTAVRASRSNRIEQIINYIISRDRDQSNPLRS